MPAPAQSKAQRVLRQLEEAREFIEEIVTAQALPVTRDELAAEVDLFRDALRNGHKASAALIMAVLDDQPIPQTAYAAWASKTVIYAWRKAETNPLPAVELNGQVCVKPSDFFKALREHGRAKT